MKAGKILFFVGIFFGNLCGVSSVDLIIYSYNRPLQLFALLESLEKHVEGLGLTTVIYRADSAEFAKAYDQVRDSFLEIKMVRQGVLPRQDFKGHTLSALCSPTSDYVMFAVDDLIVKKPINLAYCTALLESTGAYGFYLRLGLHVSYCYTENRYQGIPAHTLVAPGVALWRFDRGIGDWRYPNTVDMTIYRKKDIMDAAMHVSYTTPNTFEGNWSAYKVDFSKKGLCFVQSAVVNIPDNKVQVDSPMNLSMNSHTPLELLHIFQRGLKIDIAPLEGIANKSAHMPYLYTFIPR